MKLDALVNPAAEQMVSPLRSVNPNSTTMLSHVTSEHETIGGGQQTRTSPPIPVKTMLLEALIPSQTVQPLTTAAGAPSVSSSATTVEQTGDSLLTTINAALLPSLPETQVNATTATSNSTVNVCPTSVGREIWNWTSKLEVLTIKAYRSRLDSIVSTKVRS